MLGRWDQRNWGELCVLACRGDFYQQEGTEPQVDCVPGILAARSFKPYLKEIHHKRDEESRDYLQTHALRPEKFLLATYALGISGRQRRWMHSMHKFPKRFSRRSCHSTQTAHNRLARAGAIQGQSGSALRNASSRTFVPHNVSRAYGAYRVAQNRTRSRGAKARLQQAVVAPRGVCAARAACWICELRERVAAPQLQHLPPLC